MTYEYKATIVRWVDGDTVILAVDLGFRMTTEASFRLAHVNTPERGKLGYGEAVRFCEEQAPPGSRIALRSLKSDKYGRWLAEITLPDALDTFNNALLRAGHAQPYEGGARG